MAISIGGMSLDDNSNPLIKVSYDYFKSQAGEILGGNTIYTISGTISKSDDGSATGASVMTSLAGIRDMGKNAACVDVSLNGFYSGLAKVTNVTIEQGPDPSWINQGAYTIELKSKLDQDLQNSLGITKDDYVKELSVSESIEIGEDSHAFFYSGSGGSFSKSFVKFRNKISVTCAPLCPADGSAFSKALSVLRRLVRYGPQNPIFNDYSSWNKYLQNRSLEMNSNGGITFTADIIMTPTCSSSAAMVDLKFGYSRTYESQTKQKSISGSITGLVSIAWGDLVTLSDTCSSSKLTNAESALSTIKSTFGSLGSWAGLSLELNLLPNCPITTPGTNNCVAGSPTTTNIYIEPLSSTISKSRTDGTINFSFDWGSVDSNNGCTTNGSKTEISIDVTDPAPTLVEHVIYGYGTLIQNINCNTAKRVSGTLSITSENGNCPAPSCTANNDFATQLQTALSDGTYLLIGNTETRSINSYQLKLDYIKKC